MSTPIALLSVCQIKPTHWLERAQFRLRVKHSIVAWGFTLWSWEEAYIAGEEELPGAWTWHRACDRAPVSRLWIMEALDEFLRQAIRDRKVERSHGWRGYYP